MARPTRPQTSQDCPRSLRASARALSTIRTRKARSANLWASLTRLTWLPLGVFVIYQLVVYANLGDARLVSAILGAVFVLALGRRALADLARLGHAARTFRPRSVERFYAGVTLLYVAPMAVCSTYAVYVSVMHQWYVTLALSYLFALASYAGVVYLAWIVAYETGRLRASAVPRAIPRD